ncbi:DUF4265 domain-containing protein [Chryseobacterium taichungense]|uniref:DUF4265 domain-containing protein n=1 Tax=Chryseobacterium taichungense TaxID=295069 RepID=UPI0028B20AA6|nr:DUF4265 domain-containing protein [Chryseobacterium taichungense]
MHSNKVIVTYYDVEEKIAEESLWIDKLDNDEYQIKNIPFFAANISYDDIIKVETDEGILYFEEVVKTSEHSTIQVVIFRHEFIDTIIENIELLKCSWEGMNNQKFIAIDVPKDIHYSGIKNYLDKQFEENVLDYKESCLSETHAKQIE